MGRLWVFAFEGGGMEREEKSEGIKMTLIPS
jgi:hypothetical protein